MNAEIFDSRLESVQTKDELADLACEVMENSLDNKKEAKLLCDRLARMFDKGLEPTDMAGDECMMYLLEYGYTKYHLDAAKLIFERFGVPLVNSWGDEAVSYHLHIQTKLDYNYYNCEYIVKLYLLCLAYCPKEEYVHFNKNLYPQMFSGNYTTIRDADGSKPLELDQSIFRDIHRFDFCVEMKEQDSGCYGCWVIHIFDKKSRIEIATYH